jgi:hypothetical protein
MEPELWCHARCHLQFLKIDKSFYNNGIDILLGAGSGTKALLLAASGRHVLA